MLFEISKSVLLSSVHDSIGKTIEAIKKFGLGFEVDLNSYIFNDTKEKLIFFIQSYSSSSWNRVNRSVMPIQ